MRSKTALLSAFLLTAFFLAVSSVWGSSAPVTQVSLTGTQGNENWYTSSVNVQLSATDDLEGVASTTYWLNSETPVVNEYLPGPNSLSNPSFEQCSGGGGWLCLGLKDWEKYYEGWGVLMWRSNMSHDGKYSAAIGNFWGGEAYWHNRNKAVTVVSLSNYSLSLWIYAFVLDVFEQNVQINAQVWSKKESFATDVKLAETTMVTDSLNWTQFTTFFQVPMGTTEIYVRLRAKATSPLTVVLFDQASLVVEPETKLNFNVVENGIHALHYYSTDRAENQETEKTEVFKIDSLAPAGWQNFEFQRGTSNHEYSSSIEVQDITSGVDPPSAYYRFYSDHQGWGWSDWVPVTLVVVVETGQSAQKGETRVVRLSTPVVDFGDSASVYRFQYKIADVAGNTSISPVQTIEGPWTQALNGIVASQKAIDFNTAAPEGQLNSNDLLISKGEIVNFTTSTSFKVPNYEDRNLTDKSFEEIFPNFNDLRSKAVPLPQNKLPAESGVYYYPGGYIIDSQALTPSFEHNVLAAIIFIEGNLRIKKSYTLNQNSGVVFLVTGQVEIEGKVDHLAGFFVGQGAFYSSIDGEIDKQLTVNGALLSLGPIYLSRDLGKGGQGNAVNPAEKFVFSPTLFLNQQLSSLIEGREQKVSWLEAPSP